MFTADFFAPIVDDAELFGEIAANNALSDIFAMGAEPLLCLNLVGWPREELPLDLLGEVLAGGQRAAAEVGALVVGGHTIDDAEPKYGMAVIGTVHPDAIWSNEGALPGDALVFTKPIGTGIIVTAEKRGGCAPEFLAAAIETMRRSNGPAMRAVKGMVHAATDITGFGLVGHAAEMAVASGVTLALDAAEVPMLPGALELAGRGVVPSGSRRNEDASSKRTRWGSVGADIRAVFTDAQTAGGLLFAVPPAVVDDVLAGVRQVGDASAVRVGTVLEHDPDADVIIA